ncbi:hypothetical protein RUND412_007463 [Rhizina undulata]
MSIDPQQGDQTDVCRRLARAFGGVTIIQKGHKDYISDGKHTVVCDITGGLKRSGGQGDTLTGTLVTFLAHDNSLSDSDLNVLSAYGAAAVTKMCSRLAFEKKGRAMQASDLSVEVETEDPKL